MRRTRKARVPLGLGLVALVLGLGLGGEALAAETSSPLTLGIEASKGQVKLGEPIALYLTLDAPAGAQVKLPDGSTDLGPFELVQAEALPPKPGAGGSMHYESVLTVRTFAADTSLVILPPLTATVTLASARAPQVVRSLPLTLGLERLLTAAEARGDTLDLRPLKPVIELPLSWPRWPLWVLLGLLVLALALYLWRRRRRRRVQAVAIVDRRPCDVIALEALADLRASGLARRGDLMGHYVRLTDIVRPYLERRFGFPAVDQTTGEILATVGPVLGHEDPVRAAELERELERLLNSADLVKFAKAEPAAALAEGEIDRASEFVKATAPRRVPPAEIAATSGTGTAA
jgi:hypothetical protein